MGIIGENWGDEEFKEMESEHKIDFLIARIDKLEAALRDVFSLIDDGFLVRNTSNDSQPDFALRMIEPLHKLSKAKNLLGEE